MDYAGLAKVASMEIANIIDGLRAPVVIVTVNALIHEQVGILSLHIVPRA